MAGVIFDQNKVPTILGGDYLLSEDSIWVEYNGISINITPSDIGIKVSAYPRDKEDEDPIHTFTAISTQENK